MEFGSFFDYLFNRFLMQNKLYFPLLLRSGYKQKKPPSGLLLLILGPKPEYIFIVILSDSKSDIIDYPRREE